MLFCFILSAVVSLGSGFLTNSSDAEIPETVNQKCILQSYLSNEDSIMQGAQFTVFTHGMGGSATENDWIPSMGEANIYASMPFQFGDEVLLMNPDSTFKRLDVYGSGAYAELREYPIVELDISKHYSVVYGYFNDMDRNYLNEEVYHPFENALDNLLYTFKDTL